MRFRDYKVKTDRGVSHNESRAFKARENEAAVRRKSLLRKIPKALNLYPRLL